MCHGFIRCQRNRPIREPRDGAAAAGRFKEKATPKAAPDDRASARDLDPLGRMRQASPDGRAREKVFEADVCDAEHGGSAEGATQPALGSAHRGGRKLMRLTVDAHACGMPAVPHVVKSTTWGILAPAVGRGAKFERNLSH